MIQIIKSGTKTNKEVIELRADPGEAGFRRHNIQVETLVNLVEEILDFPEIKTPNCSPRQQYSTGRERERAKPSTSTESRRPHSV